MVLPRARATSSRAASPRPGRLVSVTGLQMAEALSDRHVPDATRTCRGVKSVEAEPG